MNNPITRTLSSLLLGKSKSVDVPPVLAADRFQTQIMAMVDGHMQPLRSSYSLVDQAWARALQDRFGRIDPFHTAQLYTTGLTAWVCVNIRSSIISQLSLRVESEEGQAIATSPAQHIVQNSTQFLRMADMALNIWGVCYWRKRYNQYGYPSTLEWLNPLDVQPRVDGQGRLLGYQVASIRHESLTPDQIVRVKGFDPFDDQGAVSPFEIAMKSIVAETSLSQWSAAFFFNSARPDGMLTYSGSNLNNEQLKQAKEDWQAFKQPGNAFKTFVGRAGKDGEWKWTPITPAPTDLAMTDFVSKIRGDIFMTFQVNPVLAGVSQAADALSAQGTFKNIRDQHIKDISIPRAWLIAEAINDQWLHRDFAGLPKQSLVVDEAAALEDILADPERAANARDNMTAGLWTANESRAHIGKPELPDAIQVNPEWALQTYQGGLVTQAEARRSIGLVGGLEGYIWDVDPRATVSSFPTLGSMMVPPPALPQAETPQLPPPTPPRGERVSLAVLLDLANQPDLISLQKRVAEMVEPGSVDRWEEPSRFHVTLVYAPALDADRVAELTQLVESIPPPQNLTLKVGSLNAFDTVGQWAVHFSVSRQTALLAYQAEIVDALRGADVELSSYSEPAAWKPHITMCYLKERLRRITYKSNLVVAPRGVHVTVDDDPDADGWTVVSDMPLRADMRGAVREMLLEDLRAWEKKVKHRGVDVDFSPDHLTDELAGFIRGELLEGWRPGEVFEAARRAVIDGEDPVPPGASQAAADDYWRDYDQIENQLADVWLDHQRTLSPVLADAALAQNELPPTDDVLNATVKRLVGSLSEPGPLLAVRLAGLASGGYALERNKPAKRAETVEVAWDVVAEEALAWAETRAAELVVEVDNTTRRQLRDLITKSIAEGWSQAQLAEAIAEVLITTSTPAEAIERRARLIAQNEGVTAFNEGAFARWRAAGVTRAIWQTVRDSHVCPICRGLHGDVAEFDHGWRSSVTGDVYRAKAHIGCRCFRKPA